MPYIEGLSSAPGGRDDVEAQVREILAQPPARGSQQEFVHLPVTDLRQVARPVEASDG